MIALAMLLASLMPQAPQLELTYLANEGVLLDGRTGHVFIDALFGNGLPGYYTVPRPLRDSLEQAQGRFRRPTALLFTHAHRDHFDAAATASHLRRNPSAVVFAAPEIVAQLRAREPAAASRLRALEPPVNGVAEVTWNGVKIRALGMEHGRTRNPVQHVSYLVEVDGFTVLHIGDTSTHPREWGGFKLPAGGVDVALIPFWLLADRDYAAALIATARPRSIVGIHRGDHQETTKMAVRHPDVRWPDAFGQGLTFQRERR